MLLLSRLSDALWSPWLLGLFLVTGLYYSLATGFFQIFGLPVWWRATAGSLLRRRAGRGRGVTQVQAVSTALAATLGTGSIAGVATAIVYGGPGAVFWMWVSALLGMMTGCAEKTLAVRWRERGRDGRWRGGPMVYMAKGLGMPALGAVFSVALVAQTLTGGNLVQSNSVAASLWDAFGMPPLVTGVVTALLVGVVLYGGARRVGEVSQLLVPAMALLFLAGGAAVICANWRRVPAALVTILGEAFSPKAAAGGYSMATALRFGVARGVFTNEAGLGTSAVAHGAAEVEEPAEQGMWGIFEVFMATMVVCTVTALAILTSGVYDLGAAEKLVVQGRVPQTMLGAPLTAAAFSSVLGPLGRGVVAVSLTLFAFTSLLGAGYYGQRGVESLAPGRGWQRAYRLIFLGVIVAGALGGTPAVWQLADVCNGLMALPNLTALLLLSGQALPLIRVWVEENKCKV